MQFRGGLGLAFAALSQLPADGLALPANIFNCSYHRCQLGDLAVSLARLPTLRCIDTVEANRNATDLDRVAVHDVSFAG